MTRSLIVLIALCMAVNTAVAGKGQKKDKAQREACKTLKTALIDQFDQDDNGKLTGKERKALNKALADPDEEITALLDTNGDGELSGKEKSAARSCVAPASAKCKRKKGEKGAKAKKRAAGKKETSCDSGDEDSSSEGSESEATE
jgi:hypothetical protein